MHKKILAGLAVGFIAAVGIAVPAQAAPFVSSTTNADIAVLRAVPERTVDVLVVAANTVPPLVTRADGARLTTGPRSDRRHRVSRGLALERRRHRTCEPRGGARPNRHLRRS